MENSDSKKVRYSVDGNYYDIPSDKVQDFEQDMPQARQVYRVGDETYAIPLNEREGFAADNPGAQHWDGSYVNPNYQPEPQPQAQEQPVQQPEEKKSFWARLAQRLSQSESSPQGTSIDQQPVQQPKQEEAMPTEWDERSKEFDADYEAFTGAINSRLNEKNEALKQRSIDRENKMGRFLSSIYNAGQAEGGAAIVPQHREELEAGGDPEADALRAASQLFDSAKRVKDAAYEKKGVLGGLGDSFTVDNWDFGATDLKTAQQVYALAQKLEKKQQLTESENLLLEAMVQNAFSNEYYGDKLKRGYKAGQVTGESLPFMLEFLINPLAGAGEEAVAGGAVKFLERRLAKEMAKRAAKQAEKAGVKAAEKSLIKKAGELAVKGVAKGADDLISAAGIAASTGGIRTAADAYNRMNGQVMFHENEDGILEFDGFYGGEENPLAATAKAYGSMLIEDFSEMCGNYFRPAGEITKKGIYAINGKIGLSKVNQILDGVGSAQWVKVVDDFLKHTKWDGIGGEFGEEIVGGVLNALTVHDQTLSASDPEGVFNPDNLIDTFLGVSIFGGVVSVVKTAGYRSAYDRNLAARDEVSNEAATYFPEDDWNRIREQIDAADEKEVGKIVEAALMPGSEYTSQQKAIIGDYARLRVEGIGIDKGQKIVEDYVKQGEREGRQASSPEEINRLQIEGAVAEAKAAKEAESGDVSGSTQLDVDRAEAVKRGRREAVRSGIEEKVGQPIAGENEMVHMLSYPDGREVFLVSQDEDGNYATVDSEGKKGFLTGAQLVEEVESNGATDRNVALNEYLDGKVGEQDAQAEQQRLGVESKRNLQAVQQRVQQEGRINMGTPETEVWGTVIDMNPAPEGGITVQVDGEKESVTMSWQDVASAYGMPLMPKTNSDIVAERMANEGQVDNYNTKIPPFSQLHVRYEGMSEPVNYTFKNAELEDGQVIIKASDPETGEVVDLLPEMVENIDALMQKQEVMVDVDGNPVPEAVEAVTPTNIFNDQAANELGISQDYAYTTKKGLVVVDGGKLWAENPKLWAEWNDRNPERALPTKDYLAAKLQEIGYEVEKAQSDLETEAKGKQRPDVMDDLREAVREKVARQQTIADIYNRYENAEVEAIGQEVDAAVEAQAAEEAQQPEEQVPASVSAGEATPPATAEEIIASTQAAIDELRWQMHNAKTQEEFDNLMQAKAIVLQDMFDALGAEKTVTTTMSQLFDEMQERGATANELQQVKDILTYAAATKQNLDGFYSWGADTIFMIADGLPTAAYANRINIHEGKHEENRWSSAHRDALTTGVSRGELLSVMQKYKGTHGYDTKTNGYLADEVLAVSAEIAEDDGVEAVSQKLRDLGVVNEDFITFVQNNIDYGRRNGQRLHYAARPASEHANPQVNSGYDADSGRGQSGDLGGSGVRSSETGDRGSGEEGEGEPAEPAGESEPAVSQSGLSPDQEAVIAEHELAKEGVASNEEESRFSVRYVPEEDKIDGIAEDISRLLGIPKEKAIRWVQSETSLAPIILDEHNSPFLNYDADERYTAIKEDSDYPQGTVDFNNICRKRIAFTNVFQRLQRDFPNTVITGTDLAKIRQIMKDNGYTVACGLCYVEDRRQLLGEIARFFIEEMQSGFEGYAHGRTIDQPAGEKVNAAKAKKAETLKKLIGDDVKEDLNIYDLITLEGSDKLQKEHPGIYAAFQRFNAYRGQQAGNLFQGYAEYKREIQYWTDDTVAKVNALGGLRIFSYSDFEAHHLIDLVQIIQDCAKRGVMIQGYTKVPAFARAVASTNIKLNRSLIPLGDTGIVDGQLAFDPVEGIDINDPDFIESNDNVGNCLVGINDEQIRLAMADPNIHYIIPYHSNQKGILRTLKQTGAWTNYKNEQTEKGEGAGKHGVNIYTDVLAAAESEGNPITNEREFVEKFLAVCAERGWTPRFSRFLDTDEAGNYVYTPGYYKLLLDFKMFDEAGNILPQMPVVAEFDDAFNQKILEDYVKDAQTDQDIVPDDVYEEIVEALDIRPSISAPQELTEAQKKALAFVNGETMEQKPDEKEADQMRFSVSSEIAEKYPNWMDNQVTTDVEGGKKGQNTQVAGTVGTYKKVGDWIADNIGKNAKILDASSGLGLGTLELRLQGFSVDDVEPYPGRGRQEQPTYGGVDAYQQAMDAGKEYDFIISNAVLNVIPDDWRSAVLQDMATLLKPGGQMFINTRKAGEEKTIKNKIELESPQEVLVGTPDKITSYQRFFTPQELKEYVEGQLGDGYTVEVANKKNSGTSGLAAVVVKKQEQETEPRFSVTEEQDKEYMDAVQAGDMEKAQRMVDEAAKAAMPETVVVDGNYTPRVVLHGTNAEFNVFDERKSGSATDPGWLGRGFYFYGNNPEYASQYGRRIVRAFLNIKNPYFADYEDIKRLSEENSTEASEEFRQSLIDEGYDGVNYNGDLNDEWVAFYPSQIKSADPITYDDSGNVIPLSERFNPENDDIRFSVSEETNEETSKLFDAAKERFGTTKDLREAGYILPDGTMLDFSGRHWTSGGDNSWLNGMRQVDHRDIGDLEFERDGNTPSGLETDMSDFIRRGAIRINYPNSINLSVKPTAEQRAVLERMLQNGGFVRVDFGDGNHTDHSADYEGVKPARVLNDIKRYFDEGYKPEGTESIRFSVANENQAIFVSNAQRALDGIKMEKATPEQWLKMLEKSGGLKAGEDKWLGLSDWLKSQGKPVSFDDYFDRTKVQWKKVDVPQGKGDFLAYYWNYDIVDKGARHYSPYASSDSQYVIDREDGKIYRYSDHWGNVGSCQWPINEEQQHTKRTYKSGGAEHQFTGYGFTIAEADIKDFKRLPLTKQEIADFIDENKIQIEETRYAEDVLRDDEQALRSYQEEFNAIAEENGGNYNAAWDEMVDRYGDDFESAFDLSGESLEPATDWNGDLDPAAQYFLDQRREEDTERINTTRLHYTTEGLTRNREIALTVPTIEPWNENDQIHFGDAGEGRAIAWVRFGDAQMSADDFEEKRAAYEEAAKKLDETRNNLINKYALEATGSKRYFELATPEEKAELDAVKADERAKFDEYTKARYNYKKVLFIDEIQSKRHQEGREKGYRGSKETAKRKEELMRAYNDLMRRADYSVKGYFENEEDLQEYSRLQKELRDISEEEGKGIPAAPFEKNWHELAMKRMLRLAAEEGYDYVAWTTGEQQAERYDIGGVVPYVDVSVNPDDDFFYRDLRFTASGNGCRVSANKEGKITLAEGIGQDAIGKPLSEVFGKDLAVQIMSADREKRINLENTRVGGEGMKGFYDEMLPRFVDKYTKKWNTKTGDRQVTLSDGAMLDAHVLPVTQEMKDSVMEGQLMFSVSQQEQEDRQRLIGEVEKGGLAAVLGEEGRADIYRTAYAAIPNDVLRPVVEAGIGDMDLRGHVRKYLHDLAQNGTENDATGLLFKMFDDIRFMTANPSLTDADIRWMIWKDTSDAKDGDLLAMAEDLAMRNRWGVGEASVEQNFKESAESAAKTAEEAVEGAAKTVEAEEKELKDTQTYLKAVAKDTEENAVYERINSISKAMAAQKAYDRATVDSLVRLAKDLLKSGKVADLRPRDVSRLVTLISSSTGKSPKNVRKYADQLMDLLLTRIVAQEEERFMRLVKTKATRVNQGGVEVLAKLDKAGQTVMQEFKDYMNASEAAVEERLQAISDKMDSKDDAVRSEGMLEYFALQLALKYKENIASNVEQYNNLHRAFKDAEKGLSKGVGQKAYDQYVTSAMRALRSLLMERVDMYRDLSAQLNDLIKSSAENAAEFRKADKQRIEDIHHDANRDMQGTPRREHLRDNRWQRFVNSFIVRFFAQSLSTADQMYRMLGRKNINGEGWLHTRFFKDGFIKAAENASKGLFEALDTLDKKVSDVFGKKMKWSDLYTLERRLPGMTVTFMDGGEMVEHELTQGNMLYIYMANKMVDGQMKLRSMGITEEDVEAIQKNLDPRFIELADWMQDEFYVQLRNKYNEVYERMFGTQMGAIEDYVPLKILKNARYQEVDTNQKEAELSSTITGSIIKRTKNSYALDILNTDAFSLAVEHVQQMEDWSAFAELRRDMNTLLSYKLFRNEVQNMTTIYGSGKNLWDELLDVSSILVGNYKPKVGKRGSDALWLNMAKGVTMAKIAFRVNTAIKQLLSFPAYLPDARPDILLKNIGAMFSKSNEVNPWKWCMENLPLFEKRWKSRIVGDTRLMDTESDWKFWRNKIVKGLGRAGMTPNAAVDAATVAVGAKSMYDTKKAQYLKDGYSEEQADDMAKKDAEILYNQTQQSSENGFVSPVQLDRTAWAATLTTYRNSSMSYQRQLHDAIRTLGRLNTPGYRKRSIEFMKQQNMAKGLDEEQAQSAAERQYNRQWFRSFARVAVFGYGLQFLWKIGNNMIYLLFGDDDDEKERIIKESALAEVSAPFEGLVGGNVIGDALGEWASGEINEEYDINQSNFFKKSGLAQLPIVSDIEKTMGEWNRKDKPRAYNDAINLIAQSALGVNPETVTDAVVAAYDAFDGDVPTMKELGILLMRIGQVPQSTIDKFIIDEIDMTDADARKLKTKELADRYAEYKLRKNAPLTNKMYNEEEREKKKENYAKQFTDQVKNRGKVKEHAGEKVPPTPEEVYKELDKESKALQTKYNAAKKNNDAKTVEYIESLPEFQQYLVWKKHQKGINKLNKDIKNTQDDDLRQKWEAQLRDSIQAVINEIEKPE